MWIINSNVIASASFRIAMGTNAIAFAPGNLLIRVLVVMGIIIVN